MAADLRCPHCLVGHRATSVGALNRYLAIRLTPTQRLTKCSEHIWCETFNISSTSDTTTGHGKYHGTMGMTAYTWQCHACRASNIAGIASCSACGCPARATVKDIESFRSMPSPTAAQLSKPDGRNEQRDFKRRKRKLVISLVLILTAVLLGLGLRVHVGYFADDRAAALRAEALLIQRFNARQFDSIYDDAAQAMRDSVPRKTAVDAMAATMDAFGTIVEDREGVATCFPNQVRMVRWLKSSKGIELTQMSTWSTPGGDAKLLMIHISQGRAAVDPTIVERHRCSSR